MGEYKPLLLKDRIVEQKFDLNRKSHSRYSKLKLFFNRKESSPISDVSISPNESSLALAYGTRFSIHSYSTNDYKLDDYTFTGSKYPIKSIAFRRDSKLAAASDESGAIHLIAVNLKSYLSRFIGHSASVSNTFFSYDKTHLFSGSDDKTVKYWDIPESKCLQTFTGHNDKIKSVAPQGYGNTSVFATGGYDSIVNIYDIRENNSPTTTLNLGFPIECISFSQNGSILVAAGAAGTTCIIDTKSGYKEANRLRLHTKVVTGAQVCDNILVTSSLDSTVKFTDLEKGNIDHIFYTRAPVWSLSCSSNCSAIAYGMESGDWCMRKSKPEAKPQAKPKKETIAVERYSPGNLSRIDRLLKTFQYRTALEIAVDQAPGHVLALVEELIIRGALEAAVKRTDDQSIAKLLHFISSHIGLSSSSFSLLLELLEAIIHQNRWIVDSDSQEIFDILLKIRQKLGMELHQHQIIHQMIGTVEMLLAS